VSEVIEAVGLTKRYGTRRGVEDVDFTVREGEAFGFLGPNGAGKTTTIRLLLGFLRPSGGRAMIFGRDAWTDAAAIHERVAYLGSDPGYLGGLTAAEQLDYLGALRGLPRGRWRAVAERLDLDPTVRIRKLSRGNRQKIGVVAAFMGDEPLLVLDEPTTGLDPLMQREFLALVSDVKAAGRTVFLSSHNLPEVERACDRVAIIREGRLTEVRAVAELLGEHWRSVNLLLAAPAPAGHFDLPNVDVLAQTGREVHLMVLGAVDPLLDRIAALEVADISITTPDIEDLFLRQYQAPDVAVRQPDAGPAGGAERLEAPGPEVRP
jgi:ABC-2 type transport system ATP-binding protein